MIRSRRVTWFLAMICFLMLPCGAFAHTASTAYGTISSVGANYRLVLELSLLDLELQIGVDANNNGELTWGEIKHAIPEIDDYLKQHLAIASGTSPCELLSPDVSISRRLSGNYLLISRIVDCSAVADAGKIALEYRLFFERDNQHRLLFTRQVAAGEEPSASPPILVGPNNAHIILDLASRESLRSTVADFVVHGIRHIWLGFDHILFLFALLFPAVLRRNDRGWEGIQSAKAGASSVVKVVTAFTVAHSITLSLAALGFCSAPVRLTESLIAASVVVAAVDNLTPLFVESRWTMAFVFGLIHGFGFASAMSDLSLPESSKLIALLSFNVGVEIGQLCLVICFFPLAYKFRQTRAYQVGVLGLGSCAVALVACVWLLERSLDLAIF